MNNQLYQDLIRQELSGIYGYSVLQEMDEIIGYYKLYDGGDDEAGKRPRVNWIKKLINDESRHMCSRPPELRIVALDDKDKAVTEALTDWLKKTLERNHWAEQLLKAARDAFIGKRVALKLGYDPDAGVTFRFAPSLEFIYDPDPRDPRRVDKAIFFYGTTPETVTDRARQRYWKQRYVMRGGRCYVDEGVFNGYGAPIEITMEDRDTGLDFVPVFVVVNGGLSGDLLGESDVRELADGQRAYGDVRADDLAAIKYQMFGQKVFIDATEESVKSIQIAPNAMIDIQSEPATPHQARAEVLETTFSYGDHMEQALDRLKADMHELVSVPRITPDLLTGLGASGKAMRALYWPLNSRCEERWATGWDAMLTWMVDSMMKLARARGEALPEITYTLRIEHLYPIVDDQEDERALDLNEVGQQARSRRSFIEKWQPDADADGELRQIQRERTLLEDSFAADALRGL